MRVTRVFALSILTVGLVMAPAYGDPEDSVERPLSETLGDALQSLIDQVNPAFEEMVETFKVFGDIDSIENYERPEIMPNGDVIMRRREDAPPLLRDDDGEADADPEAPPGVKI